MFTICEAVFNKLNIYDANFTNYHHMFESNYVITPLPERYWNKSDKSISSNFINSVTILYNNCYVR